MTDHFLTLMADLDDASQKRLSEWAGALEKAGFIGTQMPGLYHISLASFSPEQEREIVGLMKKTAAEFAPITIHFSHIGLFAGGKVLFCAPERNAQLDALHDACEAKADKNCPWTPHVTVLIDEPEAICSALPLFLKSFYPFVGNLVRLHLCAFWPKREIASFELNGR